MQPALRALILLGFLFSAVPALPQFAPYDLQGIWVRDDGQRTSITQTGSTLTAVKLAGTYVPAGEVTWEGQYTSSSFAGRIRVGNGSGRTSWVPARILVQDQNTIRVTGFNINRTYTRERTRQMLTYVSFANHNGLHPDRKWGVGTSNSSENDADSKALNDCNSKLPFGVQRCGSDSSCTLSTGQWAAHAIAAFPFMNFDGPYLAATSCGLPTQAAAQAKALQDCQSNAGGTMQCSIVWSGAGK